MRSALLGTLLATIATLVFVLSRSDVEKMPAKIGASHGSGRGSHESSSETLETPLRRPELVAPRPEDSQPAPAEGAHEPRPTRPQGREAVPSRPVVLFQHATHDSSFPGERWELAEGLTNAGAGFEDDDASCAEVPPGMLAILYRDPAEQGAHLLLVAGTHNLAPYGFNDVVSSVRVVRVGDDVDVPKGPDDTARLFADLDERGRTWSLKLAAGEGEKLFVGDGAVFDSRSASAAWVPNGYELTLFEQPDGRGVALVLGPGYHQLQPVGWNDKTSSARLRRLGGG